ncbi:MAG: hypothetical protein ACREP9_19705, partial [Candidatus Dormibacteraceae bacterium]
SQVAGERKPSAQSVSRWELGQEHPAPRYLDGLCQIFRTHPVLLGFFHDYSDGSEGQTTVASASLVLKELEQVISTQVTNSAVITASPSEVSEVERRAALETVLHRTSAGISIPTLQAIEAVRQSMDRVLESATVGPHVLERWEHTAFDYGHTYQTMPPLRLLSDMVIDFAELQQLSARRQPIEYQQRLCYVTAQMAGIIADLFHELGDQRTAWAWFNTAQMAADESGERALRAWVIAREAFIPFYYGSPKSTIALTRQAQAIAGKTPCAAAAQAPAIEARAWGLLGSVDEVEQAVQRAQDAFAVMPDDQKSDTALGYTQRQLYFHIGSAYAQLGDSRAFDYLSKAQALYSAAEYLDPTLIALDWATGLARGSDADVVEACRSAGEALLGLPFDMRSDQLIHRARQLIKALPASKSSIPAVRELSEVLTLSTNPSTTTIARPLIAVHLEANDT